MIIPLLVLIFMKTCHVCNGINISTDNSVTVVTEEANVNYIKNCSDLVCDEKILYENCSKVWDRCECGAKFSCLESHLQPIYMSYSNFVSVLLFSGGKSEQRVEDAVPQLAKLLEPLSVSKFTITFFCDSRIDFDLASGLGDKCISKAYPRDYYSVVDFNKFQAKATIVELNLQSNCLNAIEGNMADAFPNITSLSFSSHFFSNFTNETFARLEKLEILDLSMGQLSMFERSYISHLKSLKTLRLSFNCLQSLPNDVFHDLINLEELSLSNNQLTFVPKDIFMKNNQLWMLQLSRNSLKDLPKHVFDELTELTNLYLDNNQLEFLREDVFTQLTKLEVLWLSGNRLSHIPENLFEFNKYVKDLSFYGNPLGNIPTLKLRNFRTDGAQSFSFTKINMSTLHLPLMKRIKSIDNIDISNNCVQLIENDWDAWKFLYVRYNPMKSVTCNSCCLVDMPLTLFIGVSDFVSLYDNDIDSINMRDLDFMVQLNRVDLTYNNIQTINVEWKYPIVRNSSKPIKPNPNTEIILEKNYLINCDCHLFNFLIFLNNDESHLPPGEHFSDMKFQVNDMVCHKPSKVQGTPVKSLKYSDLICDISQNEGCIENCSCYFQPSNDISVLNCSGLQLNMISQLPVLHHSTIIHLENNNIESIPINTTLPPGIKELYLSNNKLSSLKNFINISNLQGLYLQNNLLTKIEPPILQMLSSETNVRLALSGNPFKCTCDLWQSKKLWFNSDLIIDLLNVTCILNNNSKLYLVNSTDYQLCPSLKTETNKTIRTVLPILAIFLILFGASVVLLHQFQDRIKLWLYVNGLCLKFVTEEDVDSEKAYDAFVSYSTKDDTWVAEVLVPELETGKPQYTLCLHDRDWVPGEWITEQIVQSVKRSRRTLIVLTEHFVQSEWSRLEFLAAYQQMVEEKVNRLIVIVPGEVPDVISLEEELQNFVVNNTYIKWDHPNFWRKLKCAMPRVITDKSPKQPT